MLDAVLVALTSFCSAKTGALGVYLSCWCWFCLCYCKENIDCVVICKYDANIFLLPACSFLFLLPFLVEIILIALSDT